MHKTHLQHQTYNFSTFEANVRNKKCVLIKMSLMFNEFEAFQGPLKTQLPSDFAQRSLRRTPGRPARGSRGSRSLSS